MGRVAVRMTARDWASIDAEMGRAEAAARQNAGDVSVPSRVRAAGAEQNPSTGARHDPPAEADLVTVELTLADWQYVIGTLIRAQADYTRGGETQRLERCRQAHVAVARSLGRGGPASVQIRLVPADPGDTAAMERHRRIMQHFGADAAGLSEEEQRAARAAALRRHRD